VQSGPESIQHVKTYFRFVVWGAPAVLGLYAFKGWFIGMQNARTPMVIAIFNNVLNIVLSLLFVYGFGMKIDGIALGDHAVAGGCRCWWQPRSGGGTIGG